MRLLPALLVALVAALYTEHASAQETHGPGSQWCNDIRVTKDLCLEDGQDCSNLAKKIYGTHIRFLFQSTDLSEEFLKAWNMSAGHWPKAWDDAPCVPFCTDSDWKEAGGPSRDDREPCEKDTLYVDLICTDPDEKLVCKPVSIALYGIGALVSLIATIATCYCCYLHYHHGKNAVGPEDEYHHDEDYHEEDEYGTDEHDSEL